ncbi:pilus assembly protein [Ramlibacter sp. MAHUQ-53]|uniref:pilus assembly protein n=1 Tax=unclassified Ramlibacter TaxID=2617605 RepID=UPI0036279E60
MSPCPRTPTALAARHGVMALLLAAWCSAWPARADFTIPGVPLASRPAVKPLVMLVAAKDHRLFYEAYNDASDIDGDGVPDTRFKPAITYLGLFDSNTCYSHNGRADNAGLFTPAASAGSLGTCTGQWSGNWLNYVTTSRIDALRVVLYGGMREVDEAKSTILRRAYIPQDAHSWAKEYTSKAVDGYAIEEYTPLKAPMDGRRHFFGNLTPNAAVNCERLQTCSDLPPWLSVVTNSTRRVWDWASSERPVLSNSNHAGTRSDLTVRVQACTAAFHGSDRCRSYPAGYKPAGLLHEFGETGLMDFGLITGSYDNSMAGGRLRKAVGPFASEVKPEDGTFTASATLVRTFNALRIRDFNNGYTSSRYRTWKTDYPPKPDDYPDWGNPVGEMMYEALRYFAGAGAATPAFSAPTGADTAVGLPLPAWDDPYGASGSAKAASCSRASLLVISDTNLSYDSDQVPGADPAFSAGAGSQALAGLDTSRELDAITAAEADVKGLHFIGQSGNRFDAASTAKPVESLASVRGLVPEEPTKQGSYTAAAVARFGKRTDLRADLAGRQSVDTFVVALASPLPRITVPMGDGKSITLVPFGKSISGGGVSEAKGNYQPTAQIVDFYVDSLANTGPGDANASVNGGRYFARFLINFEDAEQGADHDMDFVVEYTVQVTAEGTLQVQLRPTRTQFTGVRLRIGYVISGTEADGVYLEVQNDETNGDPQKEPARVSYFLSTPPGQRPGDCDAASPPQACERLPMYRLGVTEVARRTFRPGTAAAATFLKDPLWYAAKWGGFVESTPETEPHQPDLSTEWDADGDGVPDTYLMVQNPTRLRAALRKALGEILRRTSSASSVATTGPSVRQGSRVFQASFDSRRWSGDLVARAVSASGIGSTTAWSANAMLPEWQQRRLFMRTATGGTAAVTSFGALPSDDQKSLGSADVFDYLRGNRAAERASGGTLRDRDGALGDFVHSGPAYDRNTDTLFVGGNDGMLHAFRAQDGVELFGFIPRAVVSRLPALARSDYSHQYFVDGAIALAPRSTNTSSRGYLYALLGRGGKGMFSLDVSNPASFGAANFLWEYTPEGSTEAAGDDDLGLMLGEAVPVRLADGRLGVVAGNGYNSRKGDAVLYIFIVSADGKLASVRKLATGSGGDNGLAAPAVIDTDNDGRADLVVAGDLKGNVWRFDISAQAPGDWRVGLDGLPLFKARGPDNQPQPITARLHVARNDRASDKNFGKLFAFFGTGAYFREEDPASTRVQSWYGLLAEAGSPIGQDRGTLVKRRIEQVGTFAGRTVRTFSRAASGDMTGRQGWYIDFNQPPAGERIVTNSQVLNLGIPALLAVSLVPTADKPCDPGGRGFLNVVEPFTGGGTEVGLLDVNGSNRFEDDRLGDRPIGSVELSVGAPSAAAAMNAGNLTLVLVGGSGTKDAQDATPALAAVRARSPGPLRRRIAWRELLAE